MITALRALAVAVALATPAQASETVIITNDRGGLIPDYIERARAYDRAGTLVVLDGLCASACTIFLTMRRVCVTERARLRFHASSIDGVILPDGNAMMREQYERVSPRLARWFDREAAHRIDGDTALLRLRDLQRMGAARGCRVVTP